MVERTNGWWISVDGARATEVLCFYLCFEHRLTVVLSNPTENFLVTDDAIRGALIIDEDGFRYITGECVDVRICWREMTVRKIDVSVLESMPNLSAVATAFVRIEINRHYNSVRVKEQ